MPNIADATDRTTSTGWPSYGYQGSVSGSDGDYYVQVELPAPAACFDSAVISYPGGAHMPSAAQGAVSYIKASKDGSTWVDVASWTVHPGSADHAFLSAHESSNFKYSYVLQRMDTYGILLKRDGQDYTYWRLGGSGKWENPNLLPMNWILRCTS